MNARLTSGRDCRRCRPLSFADAHFAPVKPPDPPGDIAGLRHERKTSDSPTSMRPAGRRAGRPSACPPCRSPALRRQDRIRSRPLPPRSCRCSAPEPGIPTRQTAFGPHFASLRALWHRQTRRRRTHLPHNSCACETARHHRTVNPLLHNHSNWSSVLCLIDAHQKKTAAVNS